LEWRVWSASWGACSLYGSARVAPLKPFSRANVLITERIVNDLKRGEQDLRRDEA
jgi:hypothetical protein